MIFIRDHLGRRQVVMVLMDWAIDVPRKLLQIEAKLDKFNKYLLIFLFFVFYNIVYSILNKNKKNKVKRKS